MRKQICICKNNDADQLCGNREADQRLCFCYADSILSLLPKSEAIRCVWTAWFLLDLFGNHIVGFLMTGLKL